MSKAEQELRLQLAKTLAATGHLRTQPWRDAVESVRRHEFLRGGFFDRLNGEGPTAWTPVMSDAPTWLERCYEDESLVTQIMRHRRTGRPAGRDHARSYVLQHHAGPGGPHVGRPSG